MIRKVLENKNVGNLEEDIGNKCRPRSSDENKTDGRKWRSHIEN